MRTLKKILHILLCLGALSCGKQNSVPSTTEKKTPISLSVAASRTRTAVAGTILPDSYTIYASSYFTSYNAPEADGDYFVAMPFNNDGGVWMADPVVYWPLGGKLDIIALACENDSLDINKSAAWHEGNCSEGVEVSLKDGDCLNSEILFAAAYDRTVDGGSVPLQFKHAQSWLQFNISCETEILRIDKIVLENVYTGGLFRISNNVYMEAEWTYRGHRKANVTVPGTEGLIPSKDKASVCNILVPEQDACNVVIYYSVKSSPVDGWSTARQSVYRHLTGVNPWFYGEKNVFNIGFAFSEITITTSVKPWDEDSKYIDIR